MTKKALAERVSVTVRSLTAYESGATCPSEETLGNLSKVLGFPMDFFVGEELDPPPVETVSFRSLSTMSAGRRDAAIAASVLAVELSKWIETRFKLPVVNLPDLREHSDMGSVEAAASAVREEWGRGCLPIKNMIHLLEANGIRVFSLTEDNNDVDAFSFWRDGIPYIFLNTKKSPERSRFDAAHELGHLVLHRHGSLQGRDVEHQADAFASAFLMPRASVLPVDTRFCTLDKIIQIKRIWNVSVMSLIVRLHHLNLLSEWHYRELCIEATSRGYRKSEPNSIPREMSVLLAQVFQALREDNIGRADIAKYLSLSVSELDSLVFGLALVPVAGGRPTAPPPLHPSARPHLRLVGA